MKIKSLFLNRFTAVLVSGMMGAGSVHAAPVTYNLTLSSDDLTHISGTGWTTGNIPNGNTYATVFIDDTNSGQIDFTVSLESSYWSTQPSGFGIDSFGFNVVEPEGNVGLQTSDIINLNTDWTALVEYTPPNSQGTAQNGFGKFDAVVDTNNAANRVDPLTFSIDNSSGKYNVTDFIAGSNPGDNGSFLFAVHIAGFEDLNSQGPDTGYETECANSDDPGSLEYCNLLTSVWVANSATVVPVPAAAWLFGSGLLGLAGIARRKTA